ncbi:MAG: class I SAM-dependent methyltransferase [Planctomycetaceae bacterium]
MKARTPAATKRLRQHFEQGGLRFDSSEEARNKALQQVLGPSRHEEFSEIMERRFYGLATTTDLYEFIETTDEWNLIMSEQSDEILELSSWLDDKLRGTTPPGSTICDLGCGAGLFTHWLAQEHPDCRVLGVDALPKIITAARQKPGPPNLEFLVWDYTQPKPRGIPPLDRMVSGFGFAFEHQDDRNLELDFTDDHNQLGSRADNSNGHSRNSRQQFAQTHFERWREAARDEARLFTVLRIPTLPVFVAVIAGAHAAGWTAVLEEISTVTAAKQRFPALTFTARNSACPGNNLLRSVWLKDAILQRFPKALLDDEAKLFFEMLGDKRIVETGQKTFDCGNTMYSCTGTAHCLGFCFSNAPTTGFARLEIAPLLDFSQLKLSYQWADPSKLDRVARPGRAKR